MFFLDASSEDLLIRIQRREEKEMFENLYELEKVRNKAIMLVEDWIIIDTSKTINETFSEIKKKLIFLDK